MSIRKRNGKWQVCVEAGRDPITGKRQRRYATAKTKKEAKRLEAQVIKKIKMGISVNVK